MWISGVYKWFIDYNIKYSNNREIGEAKVEIIPSGKGAHKYKGSANATFNIVGNPFRGTHFEKGFTYNFADTPLAETFVFDVKFTCTDESTMYFMLGDGWDEYFGYYGIKSNGTLVDPYDGVSIQNTEDGYIRVTCILSQMNKRNGSNLNPTEKVNLFYVHGSWGGNAEGYIDFDLSDSPSTFRGQSFTSGADSSISFDKIGVNETVVVDFKFTSIGSTRIYFMIGNSNDGWGHYHGYYQLNANGTLGSDYSGITLSKTDDGYIRLTIVLNELNNCPDGVTPPDEELGYNLFYIRGAWSDADGYFDFERYDAAFDIVKKEFNWYYINVRMQKKEI